MSVVPIDVQEQLRLPEGEAGEKIGKALLEMNKEVIEAVIAKIDIHPGLRVVDVGCGPGYSLQKLSELIKDGEIIGVDPSEVMVRQARFLNQVACESGLVKVIPGATPDLPLEDESVDYVLLNNVIFFWPSEDLSNHLSDLYRVLDRQGFLVLYIIDKQSLATLVGDSEDVFNLYELDETLQALEDVGFVMKKTEVLQTESDGTGYVITAEKQEN